MNRINPFIRGNQQQPAPQAQANMDPKNQLICVSCECERFTPSFRMFRSPSLQAIGTEDVTMEQSFICVNCGWKLDLMKSPKRSELQKEIKTV